jgi:hypothetical protein
MSFKNLYLFLISVAGFIVLSIYSILAFTNHAPFKIKEGRTVQSGISCIITAIVLLIKLDIFNNSYCDIYS